MDLSSHVIELGKIASFVEPPNSEPPQTDVPGLAFSPACLPGEPVPRITFPSLFNSDPCRTDLEKE